MRSDTADSAVAVGICSVLVAIILAIVYGVERIQCGAQWPDREHRYGLMSGCMVKTAHGWQPAESVREITP